MRTGQLSLMLATLRDVFLEHPQGLQIDAIMATAFAEGLRDMTRAATAMEQQLVALEDQLAQCGQAPLYRPVPSAQGNVVVFPIIPRPRPPRSEGDVA
ncbi:MAG: hypothetical protein DI527_16335 [Chelatococcus sp.]|nr:MAG: hypothetical protein DI527_16335 [Chelatococcus sp.]